LVEALHNKSEEVSLIPGGVTGIFHSHNPSGRILAQGPTQAVTAVSTRGISWG